MIRFKTTWVEGTDLARVAFNAEKAWLGGKSHVRGSERNQYGVEDQLVGQLGEFALAKFMGIPEVYFARREQMNETPWLGDGGSDLPGLQVDVKTSLMRKKKEVSQYNLLVRPAERHPENFYVLALVPEIKTTACQVVLVGYAQDSDLPDNPEAVGVFAGALRLPASSLKDLNEIREKFFPKGG